MSTDRLPNGWTRVKFGDIAASITERVDDPSAAGVDRYVGLEHLDPESTAIRRWGSPSDVEATKLRFYPGDVIYGRRRAYQRKLGVADFDGICSAHALVLRAKPGVCLPEFLPFFLQSDAFHQRALDISVGSLSPTINWKTLAVQEFALPPIDEQQRIVQVLCSADGATRSYEKVLASADNLRMSLLRSEMADLRHRYPTVSLDELVLSGVVQLGRGRVISREDLKAFPGDYPVYSSAQGNDGAIGSYGQYMFDEELITWSVDGGGRPFHRKRHKFSVTNIGGYARVLDSTKLTYQFLFLALVDEWSQVRFDWQFKAHPSVIRRVYRAIPTPPIGIQEELLAAVSHVEELGLSARSALQAAKPLRASLLQSLLGASYVH